MNKITIIISSILLFAIIGIGVLLWQTRVKTAYVDMAKVYNTFKLKEELERKLQFSQKQRERVIDSLEIQLKTLSNKIELEQGRNKEDLRTFELKREEYALREQQIKEDNQAQAENYKEQIWKQLDQYVQDFGDAKGYDYIFGVDESYTIFYKNESHDITTELLEYVNKKYQGKK